MHTLIISGSPWCPLQSAQTLLEQAGLQAAQPATSNISTMSVWHERLFAGTPHQDRPQQPGKPWELAAGEIFLANWNQPAWGWADSRSTWLLDFWRQFDPSTRFVLLHTPAYDVLAQALSNTAPGDFDSKALLDTWCTYQTELLRFYHRNRSHCVLTHTRLALQQPNEWVQSLNTTLGTHLTPDVAPSWHLPQPDPLQHLLIQRILQDHPEVQALEDEINASLPPAASTIETPQAPDPTAASATLRQLYVSQADLQQACEALQQQQATLTAARDAETNAKTEAVTQRDAEAKAKAEAVVQRDSQAQALKDQQQESELLLLQLHQVQEELEQQFLAGQEFKTQITTSQKVHDQLSKDKATLTATLTAARDAETKAKTEAVTQRDAEAKAKAEALAQRDALAHEKSKLIANSAELERVKAKLVTQFDAESKAKAEALAQHASQTQALKDQQKESELLLLQLHQVQEELEHYFLQHQQANQEKQALNTRLTKLLQRYPDYTEWDRIELVPSSAKTPQLHCQIHGLRAGTRSTPLLDLTVAMTDKRPVLLLTPPALAANNPLLYWPTNPTAEHAEAGESASLPPLQLDPAAAPGTEANQHLRNFTESDLQLLAAACKTLTEGLPATLPQRNQWVQHLGTLAQQFSTLPPVWRFDAVQLKHQQVNPDYEHLWFELSNASFGSRHWPRFEFRLSAANIKKGKFSQHPKLEFPQQAQGEPQFENWFEESEDDRGPKFELRFDIKTQGIDIHTWRTLSPTDQAQALSLCAQLPVLLQRLQAQGAPIARPWADWHTMAAAIVQAFKHSLTAPAVKRQLTAA